jgi:hypothetical protein
VYEARFHFAARFNSRGVSMARVTVEDGIDKVDNRLI